MNYDNTLCFRTLLGGTDPGESEFDIEIIKQKNQALKITGDSIRAINEEFDQQQAQGKVWEQEVTVDDMVIGVVVRKKPRITPP